MTTIKQLQMMPIGQGTGGYVLSIKTFKKTWQVGKIWWSQVICMDETGEMPVDVKVGTKYSPLRGRGKEINVVVAKVQEAEYLGKNRRKLVVEQFSIPTTIGEPPQNEDFYGDVDYNKVIRGKIKCWLVAAKVQQVGTTITDALEFAGDEKLVAIIDMIMEG